MMSYTLHRIAAALVTLAFASVIIFFFIYLIPGDPLYVQYLRWLANVASGDLGNSIFFQMPVTQVIRDGAETSILLASITMIWITLIGVPVGVVAALRHGSWLDQSLSGIAM